MNDESFLASALPAEWSNDVPIYRQLMSMIISSILSGVLEDGDSLPSIRKIASHFAVNPLTVSKAYQELVSKNIAETKRGVGLFVTQGCKQMLVKSEKDNFLEKEWPAIVDRMRLMGIDPKDLLGKPDE